MKMTHSSRCALPLFVVLLLVACGRGAPSMTANGGRLPFPDRTSELICQAQTPWGAEPVHWLDNDRVLLVGASMHTSKNSERADHLEPSAPGIYIWNTRTDEVTLHAVLPRFWTFCFDSGFVAYATRNTSLNRGVGVLAGMLGEEKPLAPDAEWPMEELAPCHQSLPTRLRPDLPNSLVFSLAPNDGYILIAEGPSLVDAITQDNQHGHLELHRPAIATPVELPIERKEADLGTTLTYSEYSRRYVLIPWVWRSSTFHIMTPWPRDQLVPIYLIARNGAVTTVTLPRGFKKPSAAFDTQAGLVWTNTDRRDGGPEKAGAWLLTSKGHIKLVDYPVQSAGVSPDGCKLAYSVTHGDRESANYLHVMNICTAAAKD